MNIKNNIRMYTIENKNYFEGGTDLVKKNKRLYKLYDNKIKYDEKRSNLILFLSELMLSDNHKLYDFMPLEVNLDDILKVANNSINKDFYIDLIKSLKNVIKDKKENSILIQNLLKRLYERDDNSILIKLEKRKINRSVKLNNFNEIKKRGRL